MVDAGSVLTESAEPTNPIPSEFAELLTRKSVSVIKTSSVPQSAAGP